MTVLTIVLLILLVFLVGYMILLKKEISYISSQLITIKELETNKRLLNDFRDKSLVKMVQEMNDYIDLKKELELANKQNNLALRNLVLNTSHDLRTPLTAIRGYLHMLELEKLTEEQQENYLRIINHKLLVLSQQVDGFFELSKLDSADYYVSLVPINIYPILTELLIGYYEDFEKQGISMEVELEDQLVLSGNQAAIEKIFHNLLTNTLQNAKSCAKLRGYMQDQLIIFQITNDTEDFDVKNLPHLFDKFATFSQRADRNGLGLFIVKELITKMNGEVSAKYIEKQFCIELKFEV